MAIMRQVFSIWLSPKVSHLNKSDKVTSKVQTLASHLESAVKDHVSLCNVRDAMYVEEKTFRWLCQSFDKLGVFDIIVSCTQLSSTLGSRD